jgi:hypothetical protein
MPWHEVSRREGRDEIHRYTDRENMNDTGHAMVVVLVPYE